jgi:DNA-binding transcriptional LysR family regulator
MGLSLSTLSKYITRLENELSVKLFCKSFQRLELTREGELVYPSFEYIVKQYSNQCAEIDKLSSGYESTFSVALAFHQIRVVRQLVAFIKAEPAIKLNLIESSAADICSMLDSGTVDVGITYGQLVERKYPQTHQLYNDRLVAVVSDNHPLAKQKAVSINDLKEDAFILYCSDHVMYRYLLNICVSAGFAPKCAHNDLRLTTILLNVAAGNGVSIFTESTVEMLGVGGITTLDLHENPELTTCLICASEHPAESLSKLISSLLPGGLC